jgi:GntR family transcriptional regulator
MSSLRLAPAFAVSWLPGENLPTTGQLAERYGVAVMTVTSAIGVLRDEGLIRTRQGLPAVVIATPEDSPEFGERPSEEFTAIMTAIAEVREELGEFRVRLEALEADRTQARTDVPE